MSKQTESKTWLAGRAQVSALALIGEGNATVAADRYCYMAGGHIDSHTKWSSSRYEAAGILRAFRACYGREARRIISDLLKKQFEAYWKSYVPTMRLTARVAELTRD